MRCMKEKTPKIDPANDDFGAVCNCAVRYCLGRRTYMPKLVQDFIYPYLKFLTDKTLAVFVRDIENCVKQNLSLGNSYDRENWLNFCTVVKQELERRERENYHVQ